MCWNKEVSLITFVLSIFGCIYLYKRNEPNDRWIAIFGAIVAMIQLAEFFMWSDQSLGKMNQLASMFALLILALEPIGNMIGGIYFSNSPNKNILKWMLLAYIIFIFFAYFTEIHNKNINWTSTEQCSSKINNQSMLGACHMRWNFLEKTSGKVLIIWMLFLTVPLLTMTPRYQGIFLFTMALLTFFASRTWPTTVAKSMWCWFAIIFIYSKIFI